MELAFREMVPSDLPALALQPSQVGRLGIYQPIHDEGHGRELVAAGPAWSAKRDNLILCLAGFAETFPGVSAVAWALISGSISPRDHVSIRGFMRARLAEQPYRRIEAVCRAVAGECAWLAGLGFSRPHLMRAWGPLAEDHVLLERIRLTGSQQPPTEGAR